MPQRIYPTQAPDEGTATLVGAGSTSDIFSVASGGVNQSVLWVVENWTSATIYVVSGNGTSHAATQGDEQVAGGGGVWASNPGEFATWLAVYGTAGTHVNGTVTGGVTIYAEL